MQEAREQMFMVKLGFQSLTYYRSSGGREGLLGGRGVSEVAVEVGKVRVLCHWEVRAFLMGGSITQDDNRNSFREEDTEAGTKRLTSSLERRLTPQRSPPLDEQSW